MKIIRKLIVTTVMIAMMSSAAFAASISENKALSKALKDAGLKKSQVYGIETEYDDGKYEIEFVRKSNDAEYDYDISADQGRILKKSIDYKYTHKYSNKKIGKAAARKKAAKYTGIKYSVIKKGTCHYEKDDGEGKYEIKFRKGNYKYEVEVLSRNGKVIDFEKKYIGK